MTEEVKTEEQPNPYNLKKSWHEGTDKPFQSSEQFTLKTHQKKINYINLMMLTKQNKLVMLK